MEIIPITPNKWSLEHGYQYGTTLCDLLNDGENAAVVDASSGNTNAIHRQGGCVNIFGAIHTYLGWAEGTHLVRFGPGEHEKFRQLRVANRADYLPALITARDAVMRTIAETVPST